MKIAITGGIGSGKTTVCKYFENKGCFVFYSDNEAKTLANSDNNLKQKIITIFGIDSYIDNVYNTKYMISKFK